MLPIALLGLALGANPTTDNWTGFRNDGTSVHSATAMPTEWSPSKNIAWLVETPGYGQSSPVVWGETVFITSIEGEQKEQQHITAVALKDGKKLWTKTYPATQKGKNSPVHSRAAGTPVVDANGIYAIFDSGDVIALSHAGQELWQRSFSKELGELKNNHGLGSSLAQTDKAVIVLLDHQGKGTLTTINKTTGKDEWAVERKPRSSWTSPVIVNTESGPVVVVSSTGSVAGYDAATGKQRFEYTEVVGNGIPSATPTENGVLIAAGENRMKPDAVATAKSNCCLLFTDSTPGYEVAWTTKRFAAGTASPIVYQGLAYFVDKSGLVVCLDSKTGEEYYRERLDEQQWATPIAAGNAVYFFGKDGTTTVLKTGKEYEKLASNRLWSAEDFAMRKAEAAKKLTPPPTNNGGQQRPGGAPSGNEVQSAMMSASGDVVYGVAAVGQAFLIRTGTELICVRSN
jgi:outer membrane protein assembly factor BamB